MTLFREKFLDPIPLWGVIAARDSKICKNYGRKKRYRFIKHTYQYYVLTKMIIEIKQCSLGI